MRKGAAGDFGSCDGDPTRNESGNGDLPNKPEKETQNEKDSKVCSRKHPPNIQTKFHFLEDQCSIGYMDTDGTFLVTAGLKEQDIEVWDIVNDKHVQSLKGHIGPITGLKFLPRSYASTKDSFVVTASEDGTIRQWSITKGVEVKRITTPNVLTCMGIQEIALVATGNHKGCLEMYHLLSGELYVTRSAHKDPVDALQARGNYICTVVYGNTNSLKVWMRKGRSVVLLYCLEDELELEFDAFTLDGDTLILGEARSQELHFLSWTTKKRHAQLLSDRPGLVMYVDVMENLVYAATVEKKEVCLHVYKNQDFDHLLTFHCINIAWVSSIKVIRNENTLKFLVGGSALAIFKLDFNTEKTNEGLSHKKLEKEENRNGEDDNFKNSTTNLKSVEDVTQTTASLSKLNMEPCRENSKETHEVNLDKAGKEHVSTKWPPKVPHLYSVYVPQKEIKCAKLAWIKENTSKTEEESRNLDKEMPEDTDSKILNKDPKDNDIVEKISYDKKISMKDKLSKYTYWSQKPSFSTINLSNKNPELVKTQHSPPTASYIDCRNELMKDLERNLFRSNSVPQQGVRKFSKFAEKVDLEKNVNDDKEGGGGEGGMDQVLERDVERQESVSSKRESCQDVASDITEQHGCFRKRNIFRKKRATLTVNVKPERNTRKKCIIM